MWGRRKLEDNWRRKNKTVVALDDFEAIDYSESEESVAKKDTIHGNQGNETIDSSIPQKEENEKNTADSIAGDTHRPEYYLTQIPLAEEAMQASNTLIIRSLIWCRNVFKDRMQVSNGQSCV